MFRRLCFQETKIFPRPDGADDRKNDRLLQLYDFWGGEGHTRFEIAEAIYEKFGAELGTSPEAIDKQLQRLLGERKVHSEDRSS